MWRARSAQRPPPYPAKAARTQRRRRPCTCVSAAAAGVGLGEVPHNGLDASSSALSLLSAELPYPSSAAVRGVISDKVSYSFINGLHECKGRETYLALHAFWREVVPGRLGQRWKYERVKTWQPSPSTVIVRWKVSWLDAPFGWLVQLDPPVADSASATVQELRTHLLAAEAALLVAASALPPGSSGAAVSLAAAESQLQAGLAVVASLAADVALAEDSETSELGESLKQMEEKLVLSASGTTTLVLDADGRLQSHTDMLDFMNAQEGVDLSWSLAHEPPATAGLSWKIRVARHLLWEAFQRDESVDDEVRLSLDRETFDELVTSVMFASTTATVALGSYLLYWLVFVAPHISTDLEHVLAAAPQADWEALLAPLAALGSWVVGPRLFTDL